MVQLVMKAFMILVGVMLSGLLISTVVAVNAADSSFTQADRDRIIRMEDRMTRMEDGLKALNQRLDDNLKAINQRIDDSLKAINQRIDATNQRIDDLKGVIYVLISVTMSSVLVIVGFILWDRRTTLAPVVRTTKELEARTERLELIIKEKAEKDPELKEALRHAGLL
ncbi:MAG: hypothetical protein HQL02_09540 [Nitrospirae bacterium]|nr:hypothetical protein [Nitrospirota bacterium]